MKKHLQISTQSEAWKPAYTALLRGGELEKRVEEAYQLLTLCRGCAWNCNVDRRRSPDTPRSRGVCRTGMKARVSSYAPHHGEEQVLSGWSGSGTIFFGSCNLRCQFCQNHEISQTSNGREVEPEELAGIMLELQDMGCHNINFVSPSHVVPQIMDGILLAAQRGLRLPLIYNTGGYDSLQMLELLDGVIDVYMPDMKYASEATGRKFSKVINYPSHNQAAVREMHRQVGDLEVNEFGLAVRGLLVRHLVLPDDHAGTGAIVQFLAEEISTDTYINIMDQYRPAYEARRHREINRPLAYDEFIEAIMAARASGLDRLDNRIRSRVL